MSDLNINTNDDEIDCNEFVMRVLICGFIIIMVFCLFMFTINAIFVGPKNADSTNKDFDNPPLNFNNPEPMSKQVVINEEANDDIENTQSLVEPNSIIKTVIKPLQGNIIDIILNKERVPIDYWIFQEMSKTRSIDDKAVVYMTDLQDSTFSNQNARRLIHEILTGGRCGPPDDENYPTLCLYTIPKICSDKRIFINWIFNHSWFTSARTKRYRMYNLYKKYFPIPLEADDYDSPLLEDAKPYSTANPTNVDKSDIKSENYLDVPQTTKVMCSDQLFVEQDQDFSLYCNSEFLKWTGEGSDLYQPIVARYYMMVVTDPKPIFSYTGDGLVTIDESTLPSGHTSRLKYTNKGYTKKLNNQKPRVESLSKLITADPLISWRRINDRVNHKLSKLGELMIFEHRQESMVDGIQKLLNRSHIDMYQTFGIDIVIRNGEPYIFKIDASPVFKEYGSPIAHDVLESLIDRTKLMLRL